MADDLPVTFEIGELLSAAVLNRMQRLILERLAAHDHSGGTQAAPLGESGLADGAVTGRKIAPGAVGAPALAPQAVTEAALAKAAVTADKIAEGATGLEKLSPEVRALLLRVGDGASSYSQVIWRDPIDMFPADDPKDVIDAIKDGQKWSWPHRVVGVDDSLSPVTFQPGNIGAIVVPVELDASSLTLAQLDAAALDVAHDLVAVGASGVFAAATNAVTAEAEMTVRPAVTTRRAATSKTSLAGKATAQRMMTVATVDATGKPVAADDNEAISVSAGFSGRDALSQSGKAVDFRTGLTNESAQKAGATDAGRILLNLGFDSDFAERAKLSDTDKAALEKAYEGDTSFFSSPLWTGKSWLPDILNAPHLLGSGYALSGGRNIQSVTRQFIRRKFLTRDWVRVRFTTPYRNAAYAITITPRADADYPMITAQILRKTPEFCDLQFTALERANDGTVSFKTLSKLGFDLAVFGQLGEAE